MIFNFSLLSPSLCQFILIISFSFSNK